MLGVLGLAGLGLLPLSGFALHVLILSMIFAILAASWDLLIGYCGQLSFGQAAFFAIGGYSAALLTGEIGINPWLGLVAGGFMAAAAGLIFGLPSLRLRGPYLALTTLALGETVKVVIDNWTDVTRGHLTYFAFERFPGIEYSRQNYYYLSLALCVASVTALFVLGNKTKLGLAWRTIRDDEIRARTLGLNTTKYKLTAFTISAFVAGVAGAFSAYYVKLVAPTMADLFITANAVAMALLGGRGTIVGAVIGALLLVHLSQYLRIVGVVYSDIATGLLLVLIIFFVPDGLIGVGKRLARRLGRADAVDGEPVTGPPATNTMGG
jgi:branched-chain amino acid transport system permease protein